MKPESPGVSANVDSPAGAHPPGRLWTADFNLTLTAIFGMMLCQTLFNTVGPLVIGRTSGNIAYAGYAAAAFAIATVCLEIFCPRLMRRYTQQQLFFAALAIQTLAGLTFTLAFDQVSLMMLANVIRGIGFGIGAVQGGTLIARIAPPERQGEAIGYYGLTTAVPTLMGPVVGLSAYNAIGYVPVFVLSIVGTVIGALAIVRVTHGRGAAITPPTSMKMLSKRTGEIVLPLIAWCIFCWSYGALFAVGALALPAAGLASASSFFFFLGLSRSGVRWIASREADKRSPKTIILIAVAISAVGLAVLAIGRGTDLAIVGGVLYGAGFGAVQNVSFVGMLRQVERKDYGTVSAMWNICFDGGNGVGGLLIASIAAVVGFTTAFWLLPAMAVTSFLIMLFARWSAPPHEAR